jgi:leucine-rich repeat/coiled-coil domain-containing protein 1
VRGSQLEKQLEVEKCAIQALQTQIQQLQDDAGSTRQEKAESKQHEEKLTKLLRELEENYQLLESEKIKERASLQSQLRDAETRAAGHERELEVLRRSIQHGTDQVHQLQELLATREHEHQKDKERFQPLCGNKLQDLIANRVQEERDKSEESAVMFRAKISEHEKAYRALEDEFRAGLRIEASRYAELEQAYREVCGEVEATRQAAVAAVRKEKRAVGMVEELTSMVKELQGKARELADSKQEVVGELRERLTGLEKEVVDKNKMEMRVLSLQEVCVQWGTPFNAQHNQELGAFSQEVWRGTPFNAQHNQ